MSTRLSAACRATALACWPLALLTVTLALTLPAQALTRTFVSAAGSDGNPCTITQPCATFAAAYNATAANGIIAALDPGRYGPLTISQAITVNGNGWAVITAPAQGYGITVTAGASDNVTLTGLEIDGAGAGYDGILEESAGSLTVSNCILRNFVSSGSGNTTGNGILMEAGVNTFNFTITDTTASNNGYAGIGYAPFGGSTVANGVINHVVTTANQYGIFNVAQTVIGSGGSTILAISNSIASNNSNTGVYIGSGGGPTEALIANSSIDNNGSYGVYSVAFGPAYFVNVVLKNVTLNQAPTGAYIFGDSAMYFSQTTITNVAGFPLTAGVNLVSGGTAQSDGTSHLSPVVGGTIGTWGPVQ